MAFPSRATLRSRIAAKFADVDALRASVQDVQLPDGLKQWLCRLKLLYGVPFNYLVPDERMLPPESIRFFYLDMNWVDALVDGAFSIGRNLTKSTATAASVKLDEALLPLVQAQTAAGMATIRAAALGVAAPAVSLEVVSGFMLRSSVVSAYKNLGVNAYPLGGTPDLPPDKIVLLPLLRLETLGPQSNTLIGLIAGDAYRIDVHEPSEHLHYGVDAYVTSPPHAAKEIHTFTKSGSTVTFSQTPADLEITVANGCLRAASPRTLNMTALAAAIAGLQNPPAAQIDSAEMGFEMTEGVGMVSFYKSGTP